MNLLIKGIGVLGGFGCGTDALASALSSGQCKPQSVSVKTSQGPVDMATFCADISRLEEFVNKKALRRVDHFSKMAILGSCLALQDAGKLGEDLSRMGIIIATGYGATRTTYAFLDSFIVDGDSCSSPTYFANSVHNAAVAHVSTLLNITGPGLTVSQFEMSVASALQTARCWLEDGRVDSVLFGAVDEYCDVLGYCWHRYFGDRATAAHNMDPFNFDVQSAVPGEGASFFVLSRDDGGGSRYGSIKDVCLGMMDHFIEPPGRDSVFFIGADGHKEYGDHYQRFLSGHPRAACYTPLYGSLPIGPAFDIAIAALSIKSGKIFPVPTGKNEVLGLDAAVKGPGSICCVKMSRRGELGTVTVEA
jgi:3-oxoacyl-[acyl-carrier-protein] synthase II